MYISLPSIVVLITLLENLVKKQLYDKRFMIIK